MRLTIVAVGSRGDVHPLIALGCGLKAAGFDVRVATHDDFAATVLERGLEFHHVIGKAGGFFGGPGGDAFRRRARRARDLARFFDQYLGTYIDQLLADCWQGCRDADAVVWSWLRGGDSIAERLRVPVFVASANPLQYLSTRAFANPFHGPPAWRLGPVYNRLTWAWATPFTHLAQRQVDSWRQESLGLPPLRWRDELRRLRQLPHLFGFSPSVLPKPPDWAEWVHVTGYWFLDGTAGYEPPPDLEGFLDAGPPPVAIGFSSQVGRDTAHVWRDVLGALELGRRRGIIVTGLSSMKGVSLPDEVLAVPTIPYDWLLPRVTAMVHHGGAGSTAAAIRAGVPSVAVPFGFDQGLWGRRIAQLGVGAGPLPATKLTAEKLASAIVEITGDPLVGARARALADRIATEDGVARAVSVITRNVGSVGRTAGVPDGRG